MQCLRSIRESAESGEGGFFRTNVTILFAECMWSCYSRGPLHAWSITATLSVERLVELSCSILIPSAGRGGESRHDRVNCHFVRGCVRECVCRDTKTRPVVCWSWSSSDVSVLRSPLKKKQKKGQQPQYRVCVRKCMQRLSKNQFQHGDWYKRVWTCFARLTVVCRWPVFSVFPPFLGKKRTAGFVVQNDGAPRPSKGFFSHGK